MTNTKTPRTRGHQDHNTSPQDTAQGAAPSVFPNILCAVDGTWTSMAAVEMAASLAAPDGHLTLLAVTALSGAGVYSTAAIAPGRADRVLDAAKRAADAAGVPSSTIVDPDGPPTDVILKRASDYDLLAIGAPATSWLGAMLTGGIAATTLSRFNIPILFGRSSKGSLKGAQILVASDGQEGSDHVVDLAGALGRSQGAKVILVNALEAESEMKPGTIKEQARALAHVLPNAGEPLIEPGKAWEVIVDAAKHTKAALVVLGSRRLTGLHVFGSVSRRVVHDAPCSVLVIPPGG